MSASSPANGTSSANRPTALTLATRKLLGTSGWFCLKMYLVMTSCLRDSPVSLFPLQVYPRRTPSTHPHGFACEAQGTLFFELAKLIAWHKPQAFLLENVKHLVRHDRGQTFRRICSILEDELGYHISHRILDARTWVPQHRERIFIAGFRASNGFDLGRLSLEASGRAPVLGDVLHPEDGSESPEPHYTHRPDGPRRPAVHPD